MRTTVTIQDNLLERAKQQAIQEKCTLGDIINDALRYRLVERKIDPRARVEAPLKTYGSSGTQVNVDLHNNASLRDLMEGR